MASKAEGAGAKGVAEDRGITYLQSAFVGGLNWGYITVGNSTIVPGNWSALPSSNIASSPFASLLNTVAEASREYVILKFLASAYALATEYSSLTDAGREFLARDLAVCLEKISQISAALSGP